MISRAAWAAVLVFAVAAPAQARHVTVGSNLKADATRYEMSPQWRPTDARFRQADALAVATFLNVMQRQCNSVTLANFAQTINVVGALLSGVSPPVLARAVAYWRAIDKAVGDRIALGVGAA